MDIFNKIKILKISRAIGDSNRNIRLLNIESVWAPDLFRYNFEETHEKQLVYGNGFSLSQSLAIIKAWAEFIERQAFFQELAKNKYIVSSSGFAAHTNKDKAVLNATYELYERDCLLSFWLLNKKASVLDIKPFLSRKEKKVLLAIQRQNIEVRFGLLAKTTQIYIGIVIIEYGEFITVFSSSKESLRALSKQLLIEAYCISSSINKEDVYPLVVEEDLHGPNDHQNYYCRKKFHHCLNNFIDSNLSEANEFVPFPVETEVVRLDSKLDRESGFIAVHAKAQSAQNLWFGKTTSQQINWSRLNEIEGKPIDENDINFMPHPIV